MKKTIKYLSLSFVLVLSFQTNSKANSYHDFGSWNTITLDTPVTKKFHVMLETSFRYINEYLPSNFVASPSVGYFFLNDDLQVSGWIGYRYTDFDDYGPGLFGESLEHRIHEDLLVRKNFKWVELEGRGRLEQRIFFNGANYADYENRERLRARAYFLIPKTNRKLWFVLGDEVFFEVFNGYDEFYDQNRTFTGLNYRFNKHVDLEGGYQFRHIDSDLFNHELFVQLNLRTPQLLNK